ncbi:hypothetical protein B0H65DRAFT_509183 [Neurospora tetraspora]|uniref:Uncharacterized protein n=1 Tax=Neurospora tetraspora TaxID=94610 RepID=A0AAE0JG23_9PEZI|nr:hypothetical protein B0H65DRAFT_509183 [Neurospora tetraspora]
MRQPFRCFPVSRCLTLGRVGHAPVWIGEILSRERVHCVSGCQDQTSKDPFALRESINLRQPYAVIRSALRMRALAGAVVGSKEHEQALVCAARHPEVSKRTGQTMIFDSRFVLHCLVGERTSDVATFTRLGGGEKTWKRSHINNRREKLSCLVQPTT